RLSQISRERIGQEIQWTLTGPRPALAVWWIERLGLAGPCLMENDDGQNRLDRRRLAGRLMLHVNHVNNGHDLDPALLAAWMLERDLLTSLRTQSREHCSDIVRWFVDQKAKGHVDRCRGALCLTNVHTDSLLRTLELLPILLAWPTLTLARKKRLLAEPDWANGLTLFRALARFGRARSRRPAERGFWTWWGGWDEVGSQVEREMPDLRAQGVAPPPLVTGDDLLAEGWQAGPAMGQILKQLYDAQLEGLVTSREQALAWANQHKP
ncbi:MAG: hypothetical protein IT442_02425, partial [Phycisphaeraceae bacterium]|nr:hypothetical protein [Phycisphaeraceae bacterium]